jgi:hypothetical protein
VRSNPYTRRPDDPWWAVCRLAYVNPLQWTFTGLVINEFDGLTMTGVPDGGGSIEGEVFRKQFLKIEYETEFKWVALAINLLICVVGLAIGCWVCENVRNGDSKHEVQYHVPCDHTIQHRLKRKFSTAKAPPATVESVAIELVAEKERPPAYLTFKDVSYTVDVPITETNPDGKLKLLNDVNGYAKPGHMIALMGTSGAGKTTLLDVSATSSRLSTQISCEFSL